MRIEEKLLILPTLYIIMRDGEVSTTYLINELLSVFNPTGEDAEILAGRSDTKFSQKVRNLRSHRESNGMDIYTNITAKGKYELTEEGKKYLGRNIKQLEYLFSNKFDYENVVEFVSTVEKTQGKKRKIYSYTEEDMISEGKVGSKDAIVRKRSQKLKEAAIEYYRKSNGKVYCEVCNFNFEDRYGPLGKDYIEIHHENPISQYSDDGFETYLKDAVKMVKPLCANCHRMIHRNYKRPLSISELKEALENSEIIQEY